MACIKCGKEYGLMVEDELGISCVECHPYFFNPLDPKQALEKFVSKIDFKNVAARKYNP